MVNKKITLKQEDSKTIMVGELEIVIKHNDTGVSIDLYNHSIQEEPLEEIQWWFDDYKQ